MDCHRCKHIRYGGCRYGRCSHPGHLDVVLRKGERHDGEEGRPYDTRICPDFSIRKGCSTCRYWIRGSYFADGKTPSVRGRCSLGLSWAGEEGCRMWRKGSPMSMQIGRQGGMDA